MNASTPVSDQYKVLALATRPQSLSELVGQKAVQDVLGELISSLRIPHALLFTGTRGTGKTSSARIFAKSLCCEKGPTLHPCQSCVHCVNITHSAHEDVLEIDGASNTGVDQIRELRESARFYPKSARYKIFIIDEVHMLSIGAFNALLKTLEEPPERVLFVLATTEVNKVPLTVRSRCMILPFRKVDIQTLTDHLGQILSSRGVTADGDALKMIAREGRGSFRDALSLLEQALAFAQNQSLTPESVTRALGLQDQEISFRLFQAICQRDQSGALQTIQEADDVGHDLSRLLQNCAENMRHALVLASMESSNLESTSSLFSELLSSELEEIRALTQDLSKAALAESFRVLQNASLDLLRATSQKPWAEIAVLEALERQEWMDTRDLLAALSGKEQAAHSAPQAQDEGRLPPPRVAHSSPNPSHPQGQVEGHSHLQLHQLREWIGHVAKQSPPLGAKLRHAHFEFFCEDKVALANRPENDIFGSVSARDADILRKTLDELGFAQAELIGFQMPTRALEKAERKGATAAPPATQAAPQPALQRAATAGQSGATIKKRALLRTQTAKDLPDPFATQAPPQAVSVSEVEKNEAEADFARSKEEILRQPFFRKLASVAAKVEVSHLEMDD